MTKKIITVFLAVVLTIILAFGISGCSSNSEVEDQNQPSDIETSNSVQATDSKEDTSLVNISEEAKETLEAMIADGDYSEDILFRVDTVKGTG
jgi:type IV pilus biogenesis protein CpaD/CtpE